MSASPQVQVVIVAWNSGEHLQRTVDTLERQSFADFEAVVWDNASTDGAVQRLIVSDRIKIVQCTGNLGFALGNNDAAALSRSQFIVTLNPDAFPEPDWLQRLVGAAEETGCEMVASLQLDDADPTRLDGAGDVASICGIGWRGGFAGPRSAAPAERMEVFSPCAAAALYRRDAFEAVGGFEARFFCYYEDVDLGFRLRLRGGSCVLEPRAVVRHVGSASSGQASGFALYHGLRNQVFTLARDMPGLLLPIALPAYALIQAWLILRRVDGPLWRHRWRGLADGVKGAGPYWRERRAWRPARLRPLLAVMSWSPLSLHRRAIVARRLS